MGFLLVCLGIGLHSQANTSRNSRLLNSYKKTTIDGRKSRQYNVKRVNQEMYPSG